MRTSHSILIFLLLVSTSIHAQFNWTHTDGPFGSLASSIFTNDDYAFVPAGDFLFRSQDGEHWEKIVHPMSDIMATWKDTVAALVINAGTHKTELHISTDEGMSWSIHDVPQKVNDYDAGLSLCRSSVNIPLIGKNILYRSIDLGVTWDTIAYPGQFSTEITTQDNRFYLLREDGIKRSDADGSNWSAVIGPPFSPYEDSYDMAAVDDSILLFASDDRIWYTHDGGTHWSFHVVYPSNSYVNITIAGQAVFVQTPNLLLRSEDFGVTWDTLHQFDNEILISSAAIRNTYLYSTWNKGIYRWDQNTGSVVQSNYGIGFGYIYELALGQDQIWAACANGLYAYDLPTKIWSDRMDIPEFDDKPVFVSANGDGWVVTSGLSGDFYFSEDNGQTWTAVIPNSFSLSGLGRDRVELLGHTMVALTPNGVMRSVDKGLNWDWLAAFYVNTEIVHAHNQYYMASFDSLYYSGDDGLTWKARSLPFNIEELGAYKDDLYVVSSENHINQLYVSPNGLDWYPGGPGHYNIGYTPYYYHNTYFRDEDYYYSFEGGGGQYATTIHDLTSSEVQMSYGNDYIVLDSIIYLGGRGMYVSAIEHPFVTATKEITTTSTQIFSINPNPVSDFIQITIDPDWRNEGQIKIYSSDGTLHYSGVVKPGENQVNIAMKDFPPALYHVVFITRDRVESHSCLKL